VLSSNLGVWAQRLYQSMPPPTHQGQTNDLVPKCDIRNAGPTRKLRGELRFCPGKIGAC